MNAFSTSSLSEGCAYFASQVDVERATETSCAREAGGCGTIEDYRLGSLLVSGRISRKFEVYIECLGHRWVL